MLDCPCRVLLIEDEKEDITTAQTILTKARTAFFRGGFELTCAETLSEAKKILKQQTFEIIILDLILPDSRTLSSLAEIQTVAPKIPIIVQTSLEDEVVAVKALELGACGYLPKIVSDRNLLLYAIRSAIERKQQLVKLERSQLPEEELNILERLLIEASNFDSQIASSLQQRMPDVFTELAARYQQILDHFVEQKIYKVEYELTKPINIFIEQLGYLQATPHDVIELHTAALKQKQSDLGQRSSRIFTVEGRYLLLKIMSKLTAYYRKYYIGLNKINLAYNYQKFSASD